MACAWDSGKGRPEDRLSEVGYALGRMPDLSDVRFCRKHVTVYERKHWRDLPSAAYLSERYNESRVPKELGEPENLGLGAFLESDTDTADFEPLEQPDFDSGEFDRILDEEFEHSREGYVRLISEHTGDGEKEKISRSKLMNHVHLMAEKCARVDSTILLLGPSGSGKSFLAKVIHDLSLRFSGPFRHVNCAGLSRELAWSTMFGHEKGAFTGATQKKTGEFELADGGTAFLDEIGDMHTDVQAQLLTFFDTRTFHRLGGEKTIKSNVRIIAATNKNLDEEVKEKRFRNDLINRLNVLAISVPPLRERTQDIPGLTKQLLWDLCAGDGLEISRSLFHKLALYNWPGNVRELRNVLERALALRNHDSLEPEDIKFKQRRLSHAARKPKSNKANTYSKAQLRQYYQDYMVVEKWTSVQLADLLGMNDSTLRHELIKAGCAPRKAGRRPKK